MKRYMKCPKQYWNTVDEIYSARLHSFLSIARSNLNEFTEDNAFNAIHQAIEKTLVYIKKNPTRKIREHLVNQLIIRACRRYNKTVDGQLVQLDGATVEGE